MRKYLMAGNWKMYKTSVEAQVLVEDLISMIGVRDDVESLVCVPFTALSAVSEMLQGKSTMLGAQNMHYENEGAFTGEISPKMLLDLDVTHVILGHSERREIFGEDDDFINKKVASAHSHRLIPILCCGETLEEREAGKTQEKVSGQVKAGLAGLSKEEIKRTVIAYEPIWAIGTGKTATPEMANEVNDLIRHLLTKEYGNEVSERVRILYGGSVKPDNVDELMAQPEIDGALVGGASLEADSFARIVNFQK